MAHTISRDGLIHTATWLKRHRGETFCLLLDREVIYTYDGLIEDIATLCAFQQKLLIVVIDPTINTEQPLSKDQLKQAKTQALADVQYLQSLFAAAHIDKPIVAGSYTVARNADITQGQHLDNIGQIRSIYHQALESATEISLPIICQTAVSETGQTLALQLDDLAASLAKVVRLAKVIYVHTGDWIKDLPSTLTIDEARAVQPRPQDRRWSQVLSMLDMGIPRLHLISQHRGDLLTELYTQHGSGVMLTRLPTERIRAATPEDLPGMLAIIRPLEQSGQLRKRTKYQLASYLQHFSVLDADGTIVGCIAAIPTSDTATYEISAVAVHPSWTYQGYGEQLLMHAESTAKSQGAQRCVALTVSAMDWFLEHGYQQGSVADLPDSKSEQYDWERNAKIYCKSLEDANKK